MLVHYERLLNLFFQTVRGSVYDKRRPTYYPLKKVLQNTDEKHQCSIALLCCYAPLFRHADIQFFSLSEDLDNKRNSFCAILSIDSILNTYHIMPSQNLSMILYVAFADYHITTNKFPCQEILKKYFFTKRKLYDCTNQIFGVCTK